MKDDNNYEEEVAVDGKQREGIGAVYIWIPALVSFVAIAFVLALKLTEKELNSFTSWGWVVFIIIVSVILSFGISLLIYLILSLKDKKTTDREFYGRKFCNAKLKSEVKSRFNYKMSEFTETGDSVEGAGWFGDGRVQKDKIYYHLYRIDKGTFKRYVLGAINMEKSKIDMVNFSQGVMNWREFSQLKREICNELCEHPEQIVKSEKQFIDTMSGRSQIERTETPLEKEEREEEE